METIHCSGCGEFVRTVRKDASSKSAVVKKCNCKERPKSVLPYEVKDWEWISFDG